MTRIVINPDSLRATARGLNEAASEYGLYARGIGNTDVSAFAPDIRGIATGVTQSVRRELVDVSFELSREADVLRTRADIAAQGGIWGLTLTALLPLAGTAAGARVAMLIREALRARSLILAADAAYSKLLFGFTAFALRWGNQYGRGYVIRSSKSVAKFIRDLSRNPQRLRAFQRVAGLGVISGSYAAIEGWRNVQTKEYGTAQRSGVVDRDDVETFGDALQTVGGGMTAASGALLLGAVVFPPIAPVVVPVAGATWAVSVGFDLAGAGLGYAADNWDAPRRAWENAAERLGGVTRMFGFR